MAAQQENVSLRQKIGQMLIIGFQGKTVSDNDAIANYIKNQEVGGVILFDYDYQREVFDKNIESPQQVQQLTEQLQAVTKKAAEYHQNNLYPLLISIDYEGGKVNRLREEYGFPKTLSQQEVAKLSATEARDYASTMAQALKDVGINLNFSPSVDVAVNPDNPIISKLGRSFSEDPEVVSCYGEIYAKAYSDKNILCSFKHFPGHGSSASDTHKGFVDITDTWQAYELNPYYDLLNKASSCPVVMMAHVTHRELDPTGLPASLSKAMTTDLLRDKLKFEGVIITDDLQMGAISENFDLEESIRLSINAGSDLLIFGNQLAKEYQNPEELIDIIENSINEGLISQRRIEESYQRIIKLKKNLVD